MSRESEVSGLELLILEIFRERRLVSGSTHGEKIAVSMLYPGELHRSFDSAGSSLGELPGSAQDDTAITPANDTNAF